MCGWCEVCGPPAFRLVDCAGLRSCRPEVLPGSRSGKSMCPIHPFPFASPLLWTCHANPFPDSLPLPCPCTVPMTLTLALHSMQCMTMRMPMRTHSRQSTSWCSSTGEWGRARGKRELQRRARGGQGVRGLQGQASCRGVYVINYASSLTVNHSVDLPPHLVLFVFIL